MTEHGASTTTEPTLPTAAAPAAGDAISTDGEEPRLGNAPILAPEPLGQPGGSATEPAAAPELAHGDLPTLPDAALPVLPDTPATPVIPAVIDAEPETPMAIADDLPTLAAPVTPAVTSTVTSTDDEPELSGDAEPATSGSDHPMAHLMPAKSAPSEASRRAAEIREAKKAKAKKIKIGVAIGAIVVAVVAGPPLWSWLSNAVNEAGSTTTEEPVG